MSQTPVRPRRGRPLKFGRPARLVTLTVPDDVVTWLGGLDADLGWALVKLHQRATKGGRSMAAPLVELAHVPGHRALILVRPALFQHLKGVAIIPLSDGRGFLALQQGRGVADLEIAVIDRLEVRSLGAPEREALELLRARLKQWRQDGIEFESRSIVVAMRQKSAVRARALSPLQPARPGHGTH